MLGMGFQLGSGLVFYENQTKTKFPTIQVIPSLLAIGKSRIHFPKRWKIILNISHMTFRSINVLIGCKTCINCCNGPQIIRTIWCDNQFWSYSQILCNRMSISNRIIHEYDRRMVNLWSMFVIQTAGPSHSALSFGSEERFPVCPFYSFFDIISLHFLSVVY